MICALNRQSPEMAADETS